MSQIKQVFSANGQIFESKAEAVDFLRRPLIIEALRDITVSKDIIDWLLNNQELVELAFESGTIKRVTKAERKKLDLALEVLKTIDEPKLDFLQTNADAIAESFRWPSVKRMTEPEKLICAKNTLMGEAEDEKFVDWILENKLAILEAYKAGIVKRAVHPKAAEALAAYREKMAKEKAEREAAAEETPAE